MGEAAKSSVALPGSPLRGRHGFDVILGSQIVYVPGCIPALVETIDFFLAPDGEMLLYNDAVSTGSTQEACRQELDRALSAHGFHVQAVLRPCREYCVPEAAQKVLESTPWAYLLQITRAESSGPV